MSTHELAKLMAEFECWDATNLDGGGSSVMVGRDEEGEVRILNRPSGPIGPRPLPVMLGVRRHKTP